MSCQKVIDMTNCHTQVTKPSNSNDISITKVSHISNSKDKIIEKVSQNEIAIASEFLSETKKQKHVIKIVLEQFQNLLLKYSTRDNNYFDCLVLCSLCDKNYKKENIRNYIESL
ncbi:34260_t:CDS:2 [Gigaspora margarita]|uniref:34260_t:CDS:1 n=1 Tax=Gigaspora margarita TaxID=4874 RepID=A0ABN7WLX1_GIGMA|nr:34260_t:CDS:2 [Gigaspora margarita]